MAWKCPACGLLNDDCTCLKCVCGYDIDTATINSCDITSISAPNKHINVANAVVTIVSTSVAVLVCLFVYAVHQVLGYEKALGYPPVTESVKYALVVAFPFTLLAATIAESKQRTNIRLIVIYLSIIVITFILSKPNKEVKYTINQAITFINNDIGADIVKENMILSYDHDDQGEVGWVDIYYVTMNHDDINTLISRNINWVKSLTNNKEQTYFSIIKHNGKQYDDMSISFAYIEPYIVKFSLFQQKKSYY